MAIELIFRDLWSVTPSISDPEQLEYELDECLVHILVRDGEAVTQELVEKKEAEENGGDDIEFSTN